MATRPELHIAVAKTKSKASDYNDNFDMMMQFVDDSIGEAKDYVDGFMPSVTGQSGKFLTNNGTNANWATINMSAKADVDLSNTTPTSSFASKLNSASIVTVTTSYQNGKNGYIVFTNKLCIQWGFVTTTNASNTVSLLKTYANTNYNILTTLQLQDTGPYAQVVNTVTTSSFKTWETNANLGTGFWWLTIGWIS